MFGITNGSLSAKSISIVANVECEFHASIYGRRTRIKSPTANHPTANGLNPPTIRRRLLIVSSRAILRENLQRKIRRIKTRLWKRERERGKANGENSLKSRKVPFAASGI